MTPVVIVTLIVAGCSSSGADSPQAGPAAPCDQEWDEALGEWEEAGFSGSVAVATGGELDCVAAYGSADQDAGLPNTAETVFSIGSISKAFTAAAVLELVDDGRLSLDDRAGDVVPDLDGPVADATVEQLLLHTSGLTGGHGADHEPLARTDAVTAIGELELAFEPGSGHLYSNAGYTLLALIVEEASGRSYRSYTSTTVLQLPDGEVTGGFWDGDPGAPGPRAVGRLDDGTSGESGDFAGPHWALDGNGGLAMTTRDLAIWTHAFYTGDVVSPGAVELSHRTGFDHGDGTSERPGWVAVDESFFGAPLLIATGGGGDVGHEAVVAWLPDDERVVAVASNTPDVTAQELLRAVGPALATGDPLPRPQREAREGDPEEMAAVIGTYELEVGDAFDVRLRGDQLVISATGDGAVAALFPPSDGITTDDVAAHEDAVLALLAGETPEGREEREVLESDLGPLDDVAPAGTIVADGELRTYVRASVGSDSIRMWYALDDRGGVAAAEVPAAPPELRLVPTGDHTYCPDDPAATGPEISVELRDDRVTVAGPSGSATAELRR